MFHKKLPNIIICITIKFISYLKALPYFTILIAMTKYKCLWLLLWLLSKYASIVDMFIAYDLMCQAI